MCDATHTAVAEPDVIVERMFSTARCLRRLKAHSGPTGVQRARTDENRDLVVLFNEARTSEDLRYASKLARQRHAGDRQDTDAAGLPR